MVMEIQQIVNVENFTKNAECNFHNYPLLNKTIVQFNALIIFGNSVKIIISIVTNVEVLGWIK